MNYRFTLVKQAGELVLTASDWDGQPLQGAADNLLAVLIVEDFTTRDYFFDLIARTFDDSAAKISTNAEIELRWTFSDTICQDVISRMNTLASPQRYGPVGRSYIDLIGRTPLLQLTHLGSECKATILVKLECMEPNSVKDRPVHSMIEQAIVRGEIGDDTEVVEASSGNVAFAMAAILKAVKNKKPKIFISKMHGETKIRALRVAGCPVLLTPAEDGSRGAKQASVAYGESHENVFEMNQHGNPDNPRAHRLTTGPELYHQTHILTGQAPAEFVTGVGSGGTACGVAMFRDDIGADFKVIGVEPVEASLLTGGDFHAHRFSGIAPGFVTPIVERNRGRLDCIETATWQEGFEICRRMLIEEGLLVGASTGASIATAIRRANLPENEGKVIVTIAHDRGDRYMSIDDLFTTPPEATEEDAESY